MPTCKELACCDEDNFQQTSSSDGNCPPGYYWNGTACTRCFSQPAPTLTVTGNTILVHYRVALGVPCRIERRALPDGEWVVLDTNVGAFPFSLNYDDVGLPSGGTYQYRIVINESETCGWVEGDIGTVTTICPTPDAPELLAGESAVYVTFTVDTGLPYYIDRRDSVFPIWVAIRSGTGTGAPVSFTDAFLIPITYEYRIHVAVSTECGYITSGIASASPS